MNSLRLSWQWHGSLPHMYHASVRTLGASLLRQVYSRDGYENDFCDTSPSKRSLRKSGGGSQWLRQAVALGHLFIPTHITNRSPCRRIGGTCWQWCLMVWFPLQAPWTGAAGNGCPFNGNLVISLEKTEVLTACFGRLSTSIFGTTCRKIPGPQSLNVSTQHQSRQPAPCTCSSSGFIKTQAEMPAFVLRGVTFCPPRCDA